MELKQWSLDAEQRCGCYAVVEPNGRAVAVAIQRDAHPVLGQGITDAESLSNAHLIAAAPDMLDALQGVLRVADRATDEFDAVRAAIAKATGAA